mmetsp:Transcript_38455/g.78446  ORF Transcript_38455/g.78446 Transcript_38455/m.78446 type:complete len:140 (-) Transcript_38455:220-639(-)
MNVLSYLAFLILGASTTAFIASPAFSRSSKSALFFFPEHFERAVECAGKYGFCDLDELEKLGDELEKFNGCFFEQDEETCDKEVLDRLELSDMLLLQRELRLKQQYFENGNSFVHDVKGEHDKHEREEFVDHVQADQSW